MLSKILRMLNNINYDKVSFMMEFAVYDFQLNKVKYNLFGMELVIHTKIGLKSIRRGDPATFVSAFTVVSLVISFLRRSKNMGRHVCSSPLNHNKLLLLYRH